MKYTKEFVWPLHFPFFHDLSGICTAGKSDLLSRLTHFIIFVKSKLPGRKNVDRKIHIALLFFIPSIEKTVYERIKCDAKCKNVLQKISG